MTGTSTGVDTLRLLGELSRRRAKSWINATVHAEPGDRLRSRSGRRDPYPVYDAVRRRGRLVPGRNGQLLSVDYALCSEVLRDRRFGVRPAGAPSGTADGIDLSFLDRDPPDHTRLRAFAAPAFAPRQIDGYAELIAGTARQLLDRLPAAGRFDLVSAVAAPLPVAVISELLGIEPGHRAALARHGAAVVTALDGIASVSHARALQVAERELTAMFRGLIDARRTLAGPDLISRLAGPVEAGLTEDELVSMCWLLVIAGFETTVNLIGNGVLALLDHPPQWQRLRDEPALATRVVEETLRYDPPVQQTGRVAHTRLELSGHVVLAGQWINVLIGGANRDPALCDRAAEFELSRPGRVDHLAFSAGVHYCLGAPLARLESAAVFELIATRLPDLHRAGPVRYRPSTTIRGLSRLPLATR